MITYGRAGELNELHTWLCRSCGQRGHPRRSRAAARAHARDHGSRCSRPDGGDGVSRGREAVRRALSRHENLPSALEELLEDLQAYARSEGIEIDLSETSYWHADQPESG